MNRQFLSDIGVRGACALLALLASSPVVYSQQNSAPETINWVYPLERAADRLQQVYAKPVTYEDPMRVWVGEMEAVGHLPNGSNFLGVKRHGFTLPAWPSYSEVPDLNLGTVNQIVQAYQQQNPEQPSYRVIESPIGFHTIPTRSKDSSGRPAAAGSVLDTVVSVAAGNRTAAEHVAALCSAITNATGISTDFWNLYFDQYYAGNGYLLPQMLKGSERPYMLFQWGSTPKSAREALIDLLSGSASTLTWRLHCGPDVRKNGNTCMLGFQPLQVGPTKTVISLDRCTQCKSLPPQ